MDQSKAVIKQVWPYQQDSLNLPVSDLESALSFYEETLGFRLAERTDMPHKSATLTRDGILIGLAENGGDPAQDGCFFEVDDVAKAFTELKTNGLLIDRPQFTFQQHGDVSWKVFFVVAPDGLCYCYGERQ
ncbi:VOC family protein [Spirosoma sp. RP8]|uniref:VOC family protein n=1 Tax=Spirosoma liriopis TaxID=2937440 RepID=A0ABT0HQZ4_9BACT|nr:VOC family protein [Spirosoma liriopis]MCK8494579.1 VOC family protein [Spirosoma liriopis]